MSTPLPTIVIGPIYVLLPMPALLPPCRKEHWHGRQRPPTNAQDQPANQYQHPRHRHRGRAARLQRAGGCLDSWVDAAEAEHEYGITPIAAPPDGQYDAMILAVGHREFANMGGEGVHAFGKPKSVLFDVKYVLPRNAMDARL